MVRMNLVVGDDIPGMLAELAGSERKRGAYLSDLVRRLHSGQMQEIAGDDLESLRLSQAGLAGRVRDLDTRLSRTERQLAAVIAQR